MEKRHKALKQFIAQVTKKQNITLQLLAGDASFRKYYRFWLGDESYVVMDAPTNKENITPFLFFAKRLNELGLRVPNIIASDVDRGFVILSDFGDNLLLSIIKNTNADVIYRSALEALHIIQSHPKDDAIPCFDESHILSELSLFDEWFLGAYLKISLSRAEEKVLKKCYHRLIDGLQSQPQVLIHRDYHSRNLLWLSDVPEKCDVNASHVGVIDFQDAMWGPVGYDLVSLLKDCYVEWDVASRTKWLRYYQDKSQYSIEQLQQWVEICGIQRHMKVLGIFCRLYIRDKKSNYLTDLPLTLKYLRQAVENINEFDDLMTLILNKIRLP